MCFFEDLIIGGYATGHIRVFSNSTGALLIEACAHARWINAMDVCVSNGLVSVLFYPVALVKQVIPCSHLN